MAYVSDLIRLTKQATAQELTPLSPINTTPKESFKSTLGIAEANYLEELSRKEPSFLAPHKLSHSQLIEYDLIGLLDKFHVLGQDLMHNSSLELKEVTKAIEGFLQDRTKLIKKTWSQPMQHSYCSALEKIGTCFSASFHIAYGTFLIQNGAPILGSTLIASGLCSLSNLFLKEAKGWEFIAEQISNDDEELKMQIISYGSIALTTAALALSGIAQVSVLTDPNLKNKAPPIYLQAIDHLGTAAQLVKEIELAKQSYLSIYLSEIETNINQENQRQDSISTHIKNFSDSLKQKKELVKTTIHTYIQLMRGITNEL